MANKKTKKNKINNENGPAPVTKQLTPVEEVEQFLIDKGLQIFVSINHKQLWRAKLVGGLAKLLKVTLLPGVKPIQRLPISPSVPPGVKPIANK